MYSRLLQPPPKESLFLFGPRGVGKTAWLRERVEMVGGSFSIESSPGHGTTVPADIPCHAAAPG